MVLYSRDENTLVIRQGLSKSAIFDQSIKMFLFGIFLGIFFYIVGFHPFGSDLFIHFGIFFIVALLMPLFAIVQTVPKKEKTIWNFWKYQYYTPIIIEKDNDRITIKSQINKDEEKKMSFYLSELKQINKIGPWSPFNIGLELENGKLIGLFKFKKLAFISNWLDYQHYALSNSEIKSLELFFNTHSKHKFHFPALHSLRYDSF